MRGMEEPHLHCLAVETTCLGGQLPQSHLHHYWNRLQISHYLPEARNTYQDTPAPLLGQDLPFPALNYQRLPYHR